MMNLLSNSPLPIKREWLRQAALDFLIELAPYMPDFVSPWRSALYREEIAPDRVIAEMGRSLARAFSEYEKRVADLEHQLKFANLRANILTTTNQELIQEPVHQLYQESRELIKQLSSDLEKALVNLHYTQEQLKEERSACQKEAADFRAYIQAQNRIIAQQQLRLNQILGETPGAETPGNT